MSRLSHIAILGAECTGKTTVAEALASELDTDYVPEFARLFVEQEKRGIEYADVPAIVEGQLALAQEVAETAHLYLVHDTNLILTRVYSRHYFGKWPAELDEKVDLEAFDLTLVMDPQIPWEAQPLQRGVEADRAAVHEALLQELALHSVPYHLLGGSPKERLSTALRLIKASEDPGR